VKYVLDASALLAYLHGEPGAERVTPALVEVCAISQVNWAEALSKLAELGEDPAQVEARLIRAGFLGTGLIVYPLEAPHAVDIARLRPLTRGAGLSLGDRACLALGRSLRLPVLTTDRAWAALRLDVEVRLIR
jgi:PIN domain nuclease of toxin-antitoxin system